MICHFRRMILKYQYCICVVKTTFSCTSLQKTLGKYMTMNNSRIDQNDHCVESDISDFVSKMTKKTNKQTEIDFSLDKKRFESRMLFFNLEGLFCFEPAHVEKKYHSVLTTHRNHFSPWPPSAWEGQRYLWHKRKTKFREGRTKHEWISHVAEVNFEGAWIFSFISGDERWGQVG